MPNGVGNFPLYLLFRLKKKTKKKINRKDELTTYIQKYYDQITNEIVETTWNFLSRESLFF